MIRNRTEKRNFKISLNISNQLALFSARLLGFGVILIVLGFAALLILRVGGL